MANIATCGLYLAYRKTLPPAPKNVPTGTPLFPWLWSKGNNGALDLFGASRYQES